MFIHENVLGDLGLDVIHLSKFAHMLRWIEPGIEPKSIDPEFSCSGVPLTTTVHNSGRPSMVKQRILTLHSI